MKKFLIAITAAAAVASCTGSADGKKAVQEMSARSNWSEDSTGANAIVRSLEAAAEEAQSDSLWARYQLAAGDLEAQIPSRALYAVRHYMRVFDSLPDTQGPRALFAMATAFDINLNDRIRAAQAYELFTQRYPQHPWRGRVDTLMQLTQSNADSIILQQIQDKSNE
jgi:opacity protein-like surface antigen